MANANPLNTHPRLSRRNLIKAGIGVAALLAASRLPSVLKKLNPLPKLYSERLKLMGTWISITVFSKSEKLARAAMDEAIFEMREIDRLMSIHRSDSQISKINHLAGLNDLEVDPRVIEVVAKAKSLSLQSSGLYDPTILPLMKTFGFYGAKRTSYPSDKEIHRALDLVNAAAIAIDSNTMRIGLQKKGAALDLGSIAKGYALDRAVSALKKHQITSALIDAGGNLFALGAPYEDPDPRAGWTVGIRNPKTSSQEYLETLVIRDQAIATSGIDENFVMMGSRKIGHLFNAVTGRPTHEYVSCSPVTATGIESDVLSTVGYIIGKSKAETLFSNEAKFYFYS